MPHPLRLTTACLMMFLSTLSSRPAAPVLEAARRIWDQAPHNAFTDLIRQDSQWLCVFREGEGHVSPDGSIRIIASTDALEWKSLARLTHAQADLRDPKINRMPDGRLMLTAAAAWHQPAPKKHTTLAWFSTDGQAWTDPVPIGEDNVWLWRMTWRGDTGYGVGYDTIGEHFVRLYRSRDGRHWETIVPQLFEDQYPNETGLRFLRNGTALCLLRRDGKPGSGLLGQAQPPYVTWTWQDLGMKIGGPNFLELPDGRFLAAVRLYDGKVRTSLAWLDTERGALEECLALPSGGDSSYAGLAWHEDRLWVSYYSSHEGKTAIYLAKVKP